MTCTVPREAVIEAEEEGWDGCPMCGEGPAEHESEVEE